MEVFGVGPLELLLIVGLGLVVFGPEELVRVARQAGRWYVQAKRVMDDVTGEVRRSLDLEELTDLGAHPRPSRATIVRPSPPPAMPPAAATPSTPEETLRPPY